MERLPKGSIRKIAKKGANPDIIISRKAEEAIARLLEEKARRIARYAVERAKKRNRGTVTEEDIDAYRMRFGD